MSLLGSFFFQKRQIVHLLYLSHILFYCQVQFLLNVLTLNLIRDLYYLALIQMTKLLNVEVSITT